MANCQTAVRITGDDFRRGHSFGSKLAELIGPSFLAWRCRACCQDGCSGPAGFGSRSSVSISAALSNSRERIVLSSSMGAPVSRIRSTSAMSRLSVWSELRSDGILRRYGERSQLTTADLRN